MMQSNFGSLALPVLAPCVPIEMQIPGRSALSAPLASALIHADLITVDMLNGPKGNNESHLASAALTDWWNALQKKHPLRHFRWKLHVQELEDLTGRCAKVKEPVGWFCITRDSYTEMPRWALQKNITRLERLMPGLGQTVLAVLMDATIHQPDSLTPWQAVEWAQWMYWNDSDTDAELLELRREMDDFKTVEEMLSEITIMTRERFYQNMPEWVGTPSRILTREAIDQVKNRWARRVIDACDEISAWSVRSMGVIAPHKIGVRCAGMDPADGAMVLLWQEGDVIGHTIDDFINELYNSGEYIEAIDTYPVPLSGNEIHKYLQRMEHVMQLAVLTEKLLDLIGEPL